MDLQQLRYVVEVAETSSFTRAAERCHVTQSALSHQIAALERAIGLRLFVRSSRSVRLTEAGDAFIPHAKTALASAASAVEDALGTAGRVIGTLRIGAIPTVTAVHLPSLLARFRAEHPDARVELQVGNSSDLVDAIRRGELDVGMLGLREETPPLGVSSRALSRERLVAALSRRHPLAERKRIALADLADATFADFPAGTSGRAQSDAAFTSAGMQRDVAFEADRAEMILGLVEAGLAVSLLPPGVVGSSGRVAAVPIGDGPIRVEYAAWSAIAPRSVAHAFLRVLEHFDASSDPA